MTVVNPKSISGINSITTGSGSDDILTIHTNNGTERLRIDSTGTTKIVTGIVTTLTATTGIVTTLTANTTTHLSDVTFTGSSANIIFDQSDDALEFNDDAKATFGTGADTTFKHSGADFAITNTTGNLNILNNSADAVQIRHGSETMIKAISDGAVELYHDGTKQCETSANGLAFPSGKGIDFSAQTATSASGASTTAEVLDHYEEGTWTAYLHNVSAPTYEAQGGVYTRIGRMVFCDCTIGVASGLDTSDGSGFNIKGLPFNGSQAGGDTCLVSLGRYTSLLGSKSDDVENVRFIGDGVILMEGNDNSITYSEVNSSGYLQISFAYMMA